MQEPNKDFNRMPSYFFLGLGLIFIVQHFLAETLGWFEYTRLTFAIATIVFSLLQIKRKKNF